MKNISYLSANDESTEKSKGKKKKSPPSLVSGSEPHMDRMDVTALMERLEEARRAKKTGAYSFEVETTESKATKDVVDVPAKIEEENTSFLSTLNHYGTMIALASIPIIAFVSMLYFLDHKAETWVQEDQVLQVQETRDLSGIVPSNGTPVDSKEAAGTQKSNSINEQHLLSIISKE